MLLETLCTCFEALNDYVLEAIQISIVCNFDSFYYMFLVNVGLYKECEFARSKHHQKLKKKIIR